MAFGLAVSLAAPALFQRAPSSGTAVQKVITASDLFTDGSGNPVPDGARSVTFSMCYDAACAQPTGWSETANVTFTNGIYNYSLGQSVNLDTIPWNRQLYLKTDVSGVRAMIAALRVVAYALNSDRANGISFRMNGTTLEWGDGATPTYQPL